MSILERLEKELLEREVPLPPLPDSITPTALQSVESFRKIVFNYLKMQRIAANH